MRDKIIASEGMILTNGEIYGREIFLADGISKDSFYEITQAEYEEIMKAAEPIEEGA